MMSLSSLSMPQNKRSKMMAPTSMPSAYQAMPTSTTSYQGANFMLSPLKQSIPASMQLYGAPQIQRECN